MTEKKKTVGEKLKEAEAKIREAGKIAENLKEKAEEAENHIKDQVSKNVLPEELEDDKEILKKKETDALKDAEKKMSEAETAYIENIQKSAEGIKKVKDILDKKKKEIESKKIHAEDVQNLLNMIQEARETAEAIENILPSEKKGFLKKILSFLAGMKKWIKL